LLLATASSSRRHRSSSSKITLSNITYACNVRAHFLADVGEQSEEKEEEEEDEEID
jgi:hypothetical protein